MDFDIYQSFILVFGGIIPRHPASSRIIPHLPASSCIITHHPRCVIQYW
jgi:hypothetical protein